MLAIVIPYYKLTFFEATLQSLANQTDKRFKVYIGDDASPENPSMLLENYKIQFDFAYHLFETNLGGTSLTQQWERCIALSGDEEWIMILGDDDELGNNVVEEFYRQYDFFSEKLNLVRFATVTVNHLTNKVSDLFQHPKIEKAAEFYFRKLKGKTRSSLSEYVFSKKKFLKYGFHDYSLAWHSDDMAWIEFSEGKPIYTINESKITINVSDFSLSGMNHNLDIKSQASRQFYKDLVSDKLSLFSKEQRFELLMKYEVLIKKTRKLYFREWLLLLESYRRNFKFIPFFKLTRRILISMINDL
jgi:glycosyltransferase involved in cell wall biosynthesis